uniref:Uncharacterized protein n=1 Tax=Opuntia streptacantha TaxID=393608 RepID=A0A7C8Z313_OPUST
MKVREDGSNGKKIMVERACSIFSSDLLSGQATACTFPTLVSGRPTAVPFPATSSSSGCSALVLPIRRFDRDLEWVFLYFVFVGTMSRWVGLFYWLGLPASEHLPGVSGSTPCGSWGQFEI